jgi:ABC-type xylose transport system permease subunit
MTLTTNARIAGFTFLFYIVAGIASMVLFSQATGGQEIAAKLASIAHHVLQLRLTIVLGLLQAVSAIVLAVTLHAITRDQDSDLAMLALIFRVGEA